MQPREPDLDKMPDYISDIVSKRGDYALFVLDPEGRVLSWNRWAERALGYEEAEIIGQSNSLIFTPEDVESGEPEKELARAAAEGAIEYERWHVRKDGTHFWAANVVVALHDEMGSVRGFSKALRDTTEHKRIEDAVVHLSIIVEQHPDPIIEITLEGQVSYLNLAAKQRFPDLQIVELRHPVLAGVKDVISKFQESNETITVREIEIDGAAYEQKISYLRGSQRILVYAHDISRRKHAERAQLQLLDHVINLQEEERRRIARELHDSTSQYLAALNLKIEALKSSSPAVSADEHLLQLQETAKQLSQEVRHLATELRPPSLDDLGLDATLSTYLAEWSERHNVEVDFHSNGLLNQRLPPEIEITIYRIVQEALTNVVKHAEARHVSVILNHRDHQVSAIVEDNGDGFNVEATLNGPAGERRLGLLGMQERAELVGGRLEIESAPGAGTTIIVRIPISPETRERGDCEQ